MHRCFAIVFRQCRKGAAQRVAQVVQCRGFHAQREGADVQMHDFAARAVFDFSDQTAGQYSAIGWVVHGVSVTYDVAARDVLPLRQQCIRQLLQYQR